MLCSGSLVSVGQCSSAAGSTPSNWAFGIWPLVSWFVAAPLAVLAIPGAFGRYVEHYRQRGQLRMFLRRTIAVCGGAATIACVVVLLTRRWLSVVVFGSADQAEMIALAAGSLVAVIAYNLLVELFTALRNVRFASIMQSGQ